jgi:hypothetical protein
MKLKITDLQSHDDDTNLAYTVTFDDFDRGRCMAVRLTRVRLFRARPRIPIVKDLMSSSRRRENYTLGSTDTETVVRTIQKYIEDEASRENPD